MKVNNHNMVDMIVLVLQLTQSDPYKRLLEICEPIMRGVTSRYFFPDFEPEDFMQEARYVLVSSIKDWDMTKMKFLDFYLMQLSNHMRALVRRKKAHKRRVNLESISLDALVEESGIHMEGVASAVTHPEKVTIAKDKINAYFSNLSPFESIVFSLLTSGLTQEEVAVATSSTPEQVRSAFYRCNLKLKEMME